MSPAMSTSRRTFLGGLTTVSVASYAQRALLGAVPPDGELSPEPILGTDPLASNSKLLFSCKYGMIKDQGLEKRLELSRTAGFDGVDFDDAASVTPDELRRAVESTGVFVHNVINHAHWKQRLTSLDKQERETAVSNLRHCMEVSHAAGGSAVLIVLGRATDGPDAGLRAQEEIQKLLPLAAKLGQRILFENVWNGMFYDPDGSRDQSAQPFADYIDSFRSPWVGAYFDLGNHARFGDVATWVRQLGTRIVKLDIKGYSNKKADQGGPRKGFVDITEGDIDWESVRDALREIQFTGWVAAEVGGGDIPRLQIVLKQMKQALLG